MLDKQVMTPTLLQILIDLLVCNANVFPQPLIFRANSILFALGGRLTDVAFAIGQRSPQPQSATQCRSESLWPLKKADFREIVIVIMIHSFQGSFGVR